MQLSEDIKKQIEDILDHNEAFTKTLYIDNNGIPLDEKKREKLGQFYTPAKICIQMIEKFNFDSLAGKNILDPTCGSGNLLIACLIAGADSDKVFGNEYDADVIPTCRKRINICCDLIGKPHISDWQIHQGNALIKDCLVKFGPEYDFTILKRLLANNNELLNSPDAYENYKSNTIMYKDNTRMENLFGEY